MLGMGEFFWVAPAGHIRIPGVDHEKTHAMDASDAKTFMVGVT